ncbi:MAG: class I SAM-dependent methyltransferase [Candidatus Cloacimonetes bacterium]|nr:class I SAM-dependent methyltransferase [Candidatus Cloacimonadota bacterium]
MIFKNLKKFYTMCKSIYLAKVHGDREAGFRVIERLAKLLVYPEYQFTDPTVAWWKFSKIQTFSRRFCLVESAMSLDRKFALSQLMRLVSGVEGDTSECGVYNGGSSYIILLGTAGTNKIHYLFDSYEGLSSPGDKDGKYWTPGDLNYSESSVIDNLKEFSGRFVSYKGWIPDRFNEISERRFSFVHIDVDLYEPTLNSLEFFYERMNPGGIILIDDYGFQTCPGATEAVDRFLETMPEKPVMLPSGGAFILKGITTGANVWQE